MPEADLRGLLFIGDPHLAHRAPGFRKDDYARTVLGKLRWSLEYAREHRLLPVLLGDLFHYAHNNANWVVVELMRMIEANAPDRGVYAVVGNHDRREDRLSDHDSLAILIQSGHVRLLDEIGPWVGSIGGATVVVGGTPNHLPLPDAFDRAGLPQDAPAYVFWACHHDLSFPAYEHERPQRCREIAGIDVVINGHIHRWLDDVHCGFTLWINPGNITRLARSEATRTHVPAVLRIDVSAAGWTRQRVVVPHEPFDLVFHEDVSSPASELTESIFIRELGLLREARTASGEGLRAFLDVNLPQFEQRVADEIRSLAAEVLRDVH